VTRPSEQPGDPPLRIAHRYGNSLASLIAAEAAGVDLIELDLWLYEDRLEVRHSKTMGFVPLLWDRWSLHPGWTRRFVLADVLRTAREGTQLMLDLKGHHPELPRRAIDAMAWARPGVPYSVSSQSWELLPPFHDLPHVRVSYSAGSREALDDAIVRAGPQGWPGIGANQSFLTPEQVAAAREHVPVFLSWTVNDLDRARELLRWGVTGIVSDRLDLLRELAPPRPRGPQPGPPRVR
jgi:glycerophosphoryl diester phosphodiesterase